MNVYLGADQGGFELKEYIKSIIIEEGHNVIDLTEKSSEDFVESTHILVENILKDEDSLGIAFDAYGVGSFMVAAKHKNMVAAAISDERSAYMTREHNNTRLITLGQEIVGRELAKNICLEFLEGSYAGGRHQIRVDMLNKMM